MPSSVQAICELHGVVLRRELVKLGYDDRAIARLVRSATLARVRWGAYALGDVWATLDERGRYALLCRAAYRRAQTEVALSHTSAANLWAAPLWDLDLGTVHLTRSDGKVGRREAGVAQHRGTIVAGDWVEHDGLFVMSPTRAALEVTTLTDVEHALVVVDDLLHRDLTTPAQLASRYALMDHWPHTLLTDLVLRLTDARSESVGETRVRYLCWAQSLPAPEVNYEIRDSHGRVIHRVDLAWPELGVFLEFDGREKYLRFRREGESVADCVERERRRQHRIEEITGWRCIRLVWADLYQPVQTADRIRRMFRSSAVA